LDRTGPGPTKFRKTRIKSDRSVPGPGGAWIPDQEEISMKIWECLRLREQKQRDRRQQQQQHRQQPLKGLRQQLEEKLSNH